MTDTAGTPQPPYDATVLNTAQLARADAALDAWYTNPGGSDYRAPGVVWSDRDLVTMHAALEAPDLDAALLAFGAEGGTWLTTPAQDAENRALMAQIRDHLLLNADAEITAVTGSADSDPAGVAALIAMANPLPLNAAVSARVERVLNAYTATRAAAQDTPGAEQDL